MLGVRQRAIIHDARRMFLPQLRDGLGARPWGVVTFASDCLCQDQVGHRRGRSGGPKTPQTLPLLSQPVTPIIARVVTQPLTTPEPTDPVRHSPLHPPLLAQWVCTHALP